MTRTLVNMAKLKEVEFQRAVTDMAGWLGWHIWHDNDSRRNGAGLPDLLCVHPDHGVLWLELKTATGRVRPEQQQWIDLLVRAGQSAHVVRPADWPDIERLLMGEAEDKTP